MKIGHKIVLAFGLFILMICATGMFLHRDNREIQAQFHELKEDIVPGALAMRNTQAFLQRMVMQTREYSRTGGPAYADAVRTSTDSVRESVRVHADSDMRINPDHNTAVADIERRADELIDLCNNLIVLRDSGMANEDLFAEKDAIEQKRQELNQILDSHVGEHIDELTAAEMKIHNLTSRNSLVMIGSIGLILVSALIIYFLAGRSIIAPIYKLKRGAEAIGSGNYNYRLDINNKDELGQLAGSFNAMSEKIKESHSTLEQRVKERTNELDTIIESAPMGMMLIDPRTREIVKVNRNAAEMTGRTKDEVIGKRCHKYFCLTEEHKCPILDLGGEIDCSEQVLLNAEGNEVPVLKSVVRVRIEGHEYLLETFTDITKSKEAEATLRESEESYRVLAENVSDVLWTTDLNLKNTFVSPSITRLAGFTVEEALARTMKDTILPEDLSQVLEIFREELELEKSGTADPNRSRTIKHREYCKDGSIIWVEQRITALRDADGNMIGLLGINRDITDRKQAEEKIQLLAMIVEQAVEGIAFADLDGTLQYVNKEWAAMHGYDSQEALAGMHLSMFHTEEQLKNDVVPFNEVTMRKGSNSGEIGHVRKDGTIFPTYMSTIVFKDEQGEPTAFAGFATDITDRKQAEEKLKSKMDELKEFNLAAVGRELKMIQLKEEVNRLREEQDKETKYEIAQ